jgi:hypothetical protein
VGGGDGDGEGPGLGTGECLRTFTGETRNWFHEVLAVPEKDLVITCDWDGCVAVGSYRVHVHALRGQARGKIMPCSVCRVPGRAAGGDV